MMVSVDTKVSGMRDDPAYARVEGPREEQAENDRSVGGQPFGAGVRLSLAAIRTKSASEPASIFCITLPR